MSQAETGFMTGAPCLSTSVVTVHLPVFASFSAVVTGRSAPQRFS